MNGVEATARALVGVRFRLHGRDAVHGLDCVGLVALATSGWAVSMRSARELAKTATGPVPAVAVKVIR